MHQNLPAIKIVKYILVKSQWKFLANIDYKENPIDGFGYCLYSSTGLANLLATPTIKKSICQTIPDKYMYVCMYMTPSQKKKMSEE